MAAGDTTKLAVSRREADGSRAARRLRRAGRVPGIVYGGGDEPISVEIDGRELRHALADAGAVIEISLDGGGGIPVVLKDQQRHPVHGQTVHVDLMRVRLDRPIEATVILELEGADDAPGVKEGGVLDQVTRELNVEALPTDIPDVITHDVSELEMNATLTLAAISVPPRVKFLDDPEETVIATVSPPKAEVEEAEEIEEETELVGEEAEGEAAEGEAGEEGESEGEGE